MSVHIPMSESEFDAIRAGLASAPADEGIKLTGEIISGKKPMGWSARYAYAGGLLTLNGQGFMVGGTVEKRIAERLNSELAKMRG